MADEIPIVMYLQDLVILSREEVPRVHGNRGARTLLILSSSFSISDLLYAQLQNHIAFNTDLEPFCQQTDNSGNFGYVRSSSL